MTTAAEQQQQQHEQAAAAAAPAASIASAKVAAITAAAAGAAVWLYQLLPTMYATAPARSCCCRNFCFACGPHCGLVCCYNVEH